MRGHRVVDSARSPSASIRRATAALRRLARLSALDETAVCLRAVVLFATAEIAVRSAPLPRVARWYGATLEFSDGEPRLDGRSVNMTDAERATLRMLVRVARHWPFGPRGACLRHSLAAANILRSRAPKLRLAVGHGLDRKLAAHAWLEVDGIAVTDPGDYVPLLGPRPREERTTSS